MQELMDVPIEPYTIHTPSGVSMTAFDLALSPYIDKRTFAKFAADFDVPMTGNQADALYMAIRSNPGTARDLNQAMSLNDLNAYKGTLTKGKNVLDRDVTPMFEFARVQREAMLADYAGLGPKQAYEAQALKAVGQSEAQTQRAKDLLETIMAPDPDKATSQANTQRIGRALRHGYGRPLNAATPYKAAGVAGALGGVVGGVNRLPERPTRRSNISDAEFATHMADVEARQRGKLFADFRPDMVSDDTQAARMQELLWGTDMHPVRNYTPEVP
jgi:hypothetical protein